MLYRRIALSLVLLLFGYVDLCLRAYYVLSSDVYKVLTHVFVSETMLCGLLSSVFVLVSRCSVEGLFVGVLCAAGIGLARCLVLLLLYSLTGNEHWFYTEHINGSLSLCLALALHQRHFTPDDSFIKLKHKHAPAIYTLSHLLLLLVSSSPTQFISEVFAVLLTCLLMLRRLGDPAAELLADSMEALGGHRVARPDEAVSSRRKQLAADLVQSHINSNIP
jgi:hypothetical protein